MKKSIWIVPVLALTTAIMFECQPNKKKFEVCFSGKIVDIQGQPIEGASIEFGGDRTKTTESSKNGEFRICTSRNERFVLNITKLGFGFVSKIYSDSTSAIVITMERATVVNELNPNDDIIITDTQPNTASPATPDETRISSPLDTIPFVFDASGSLIAFGAPPEIENAYEAIEDFQPQQVGATVTVEPDALEDPNQDGQQGSFFQSKSRLQSVTGSVSTVDVYAADGMPGDYTTQLQNGERGFMVTYGAVDVNFYSNGRPLQLKEGKFAKLSIPVDTLALIYGQKLPPTIPLLVYDKEKGIWQRDGNNEGKLNNEGTAYEAKVSHFSVFNMDEEFAAGVAVCYKICSFDSRPSGSYPNGARIQITGDIPGHVKDLPFGTTQCVGDGGCGAGGEAFAINNMKANTPIGVRLFNGNTNQIISSYVFITGNNGINAFSCTNPVNYVGCGGPVNVNWTTAPPYMNGDGTMNKPVVAIEKIGTNLKISWVYVSGTPPGYSNPPTDYHLEWSHDNFTTIQGTYSLPSGNTAWLNYHDLATSFTTDDGSKPHKFRIRIGPEITAIYSDAAPKCYTPDTDVVGGC